MEIEARANGLRVVTFRRRYDPRREPEKFGERDRDANRLKRPKAIRAEGRSAVVIGAAGIVDIFGGFRRPARETG